MAHLDPDRAPRALTQFHVRRELHAWLAQSAPGVELDPAPAAADDASLLRLLWSLGATGLVLGRGAAGETAPKDPGKPDAPLRVDLDGFARRVVALDVPAGNYQGLAANATNVFFLAGNPQAGPLALKTFALGGDKVDDVAPGVTGEMCARSREGPS